MRGDYVLFGHSMGAMLAHGIARRQQALGKPAPALLFASGSPAPSQHDPKRFAGKDDDASLIADMRKQGGTPEEVYACEELMRLTLDTLRADYRACASFRYTTPASLPFPLHVFAGSDDDIAGKRIEAWRQEAAGAFTLDWFDGGHFFVRQREPEVLAALTRHLTRRFCGVRHEPARAA
jgi:surfactin synthase thioesterase subunit